MNLKMRNGNVAIDMYDAQMGQTSGGIYLPSVGKPGALRIGKIIDIGPGELVQGQFVKPNLEKGEEVVFDSTRSEPLSINGETIWICNMVDIIACIPKNLSVVPSENDNVVPIK